MKIPSQFFIQYPPQKEETKEVMAEPRSTYSFRIHINSWKAITYISIPRYSNLVRKDEKSLNEVIIEKKDGQTATLKKDIVVFFKTVDMG